MSLKHLKAKFWKDEKENGARWRQESTVAALHGSLSRPVARRIFFDAAMRYVNEVAGGEPRKIRRAMARARSKRKATT